MDIPTELFRRSGDVSARAEPWSPNRDCVGRVNRTRTPILYSYAKTCYGQRLDRWRCNFWLENVAIVPR